MARLMSGRPSLPLNTETAMPSRFSMSDTAIESTTSFTTRWATSSEPRMFYRLFL
jgi:hypothetical protein